MKFTWGTGIFLFYSVFAAALFYVVFKSTQYDHSLVTKEYYAEDLKYQEHYEKLVNTQGLEQDLQITTQKEGMVSLQFPEELGNQITGEILLFCPSNSKFDMKVPVSLSEDFSQLIPTEGLKSGRWKVKVDWIAGGKKYYSEETITL